MSLEVKKIALYLNAAGFTAKDEKTSSILKEDEGSLIQQSFAGTDLIDEIFIAENVKPDTSATYIDRQDQHMVVYVTTANTIACAQSISTPDDDPEWTEVPLNGVGSVAVHGNSRIAGTSTADGALVFYQHPGGSVRSILYDYETRKWEESDSLTAAAPIAAPGTPLYVMQLEDALGVFYLTKERTIGGQLQNYETGEWRDQGVENSFFENGFSNLILIPDGETMSLSAYVRAGAALVRINGSGGRTELGKWEGGAFVPDTAAECGLIINIFVGIFGMFGGCRGGGHHCHGHGHRPRRKRC